jgi:hypothetical protein
MSPTTKTERLLLQMQQDAVTLAKEAVVAEARAVAAAHPELMLLASALGALDHAQAALRNLITGGQK